jgi:heme exporter protein D
VTTFKTSVDQRVFVPSLQEQLRKDFGLTLLQRQSADWASRCCGLSLNQLAAQVVRSVNKARQQRTLRKTREQIARELAELDAARKNDPRESK